MTTALINRTLSVPVRRARRPYAILAAAASLGVLMALVEHAAAADDNVIVPGERIGPVKLDSAVDEIVKALGRPDQQLRRRPAGQDHDEVTYTYDRHCLWLTWDDNGLRPRVKAPQAKCEEISDTWAKGVGLKVTCSRWQMGNGLTVGSSIEDVVKALGKADHEKNCNTNKPDCILVYGSGLALRTKDRYGPVYEIYVVRRK